MNKINFNLQLLTVCFLMFMGNINAIFSQKSQHEIISEVDVFLNNWHQAAANRDYKLYFALMADESVYIGTDATENWNKKDFMTWSKPYFDRGQAWDFTALERNIYVDDKGGIVWFDELLETQMGLCRGSGVVVREDGNWKIKHYVLSMTIPNDKVSEATILKRELESPLMKN